MLIWEVRGGKMRGALPENFTTPSFLTAIFVPEMTQLQHIEDSEPVADRSTSSNACSAVSKSKNKC